MENGAVKHDEDWEKERTREKETEKNRTETSTTGKTMQFMRNAIQTNLSRMPANMISTFPWKHSTAYQTHPVMEMCSGFPSQFVNSMKMQSVLASIELKYFYQQTFSHAVERRHAADAGRPHPRHHFDITRF